MPRHAASVIAVNAATKQVINLLSRIMMRRGAAAYFLRSAGHQPLLPALSLLLGNRARLLLLLRYF